MGTGQRERRQVDVRAYDSLMALRSDLALFTLTCPHCAARISALPDHSARFGKKYAADQLGSGMPNI